MTTESGMFLYPWDLGEDSDAFQKEYAETGCNAVAPALSYHHGNVLRARSPKVYPIRDAAVSFSPNPALYGELVPAVHDTAAKSGAVHSLREWCGKTSRRFSGWTVLLHNSTLGERHPHCTVENAFGDRYLHALCPSHPEVRRYASALVEDICTTFSPDSLIVESATMLPALHGMHHEISNLRVTPAIRWLLSLCFCPHCMDAAGKISDLDPEKTRETCAAVLERLMAAESWFPDNGMQQIAALLLEIPELYAYQRLRQRVVTEFVEEVSRAIHAGGAQFYLIPSATPFEITAAFMEGMDFIGTAGLADSLLPLVYGAGESFGAVKENIRLLDPATPVGMALTLHPARYPNKGAFLSDVSEAAEHGPRSAYFYNFSIATARRLAWVREANALLSAQ